MEIAGERRQGLIPSQENWGKGGGGRGGGGERKASRP